MTNEQYVMELQERATHCETMVPLGPMEGALLDQILATEAQWRREGCPALARSFMECLIVPLPTGA